MPGNAIVDLIGEKAFSWLSGGFTQESTLQDVPQEILDRLARVNISRRDYGADPDAVTAIALITFAYQMAGRVPQARHGPKEMLFLKVLAKAESLRREGKRHLENPCWREPLAHLLTGPVGDRVRAMRVMNAPE